MSKALTCLSLLSPAELREAEQGSHSCPFFILQLPTSHVQNIVKKSKGFNWGPSAVSTTYWTGVRLCDLLRFCGVRKPSQGARHVVFAGVDGELPQVGFCKPQT